MAFKDVGTIRQLKIRLQENPNGGYFGGWTFSKVKNAFVARHVRHVYKKSVREL